MNDDLRQRCIEAMIDAHYRVLDEPTEDALVRAFDAVLPIIAQGLEDLESGPRQAVTVAACADFVRSLGR